MLPLFALPASNAPRTFRLTVTGAGRQPSARTRSRSLPVRGDNVSHHQGDLWKAGDFRVNRYRHGQRSGDHVPLRIAGRPGPRNDHGDRGGRSTLRLRNAQAPPAPGPASVWVESRLGTTAGPFTVN